MTATDTVPLADLSEPRVDQSGPQGSEFTYIDIGSIDRETKRIVEPRVVPVSKAPSRARQALRAGDVLVSMTRPNLNAVALVPPHLDGAVGSTGFHVLRARDAEPGFLFYAVQTHAFVEAMCRNVQGALYPAVRPRDIASFHVPRYPLKAQRRIVAEIEKQFTRLDAGVAALRRVQANLKRYRAAVLKAACEGRLVPTEAELARKEGRTFESGDHLLERVLTERRTSWRGRGSYREPAMPPTSGLRSVPQGWVWCSSDAVLSFVTSGSRGWAKYYSETGALFLRIGNLEHENTRLDLRQIQRVSPPPGSEGVRTVVQPNDLLISITADVGMVGLVPQGLGEAYINQHIALARPLPSILASYLAYYLCASEGGWGHLKSLQRGATKVGLGLEDIKAVPVPLPPLAEQERIVAEVERRLSIAEELELVLVANLQRGVRLRRSILQDAFAGAPNDGPERPQQGRVARDLGKPLGERVPVAPTRMGGRMRGRPVVVDSLKQLLHILNAMGGSAPPDHLLVEAALGDNVERFFDLLRQGREEGLLQVPVGESGVIRSNSSAH